MPNLVKIYPSADSRTWPWREVMSWEFWPTDWGYSFGHVNSGNNRLRLECGHEKSIKGSRPVPRKVRCRECALQG
jgi:hypothetical protein